MKTCVQCLSPIKANGKNNNVKYCSKVCRDVYTYEKRRAIWTARNRDRYNKPGTDKRKCPYCMGYYLKLAAHTVQRHGVTHDVLKDDLGLDKGKGLVPEWHKEQLRDKVSEDVIVNNLLKKGKKSRFKKGHTMNYVRSRETMERLRRNGFAKKTQ